MKRLIAFVVLTVICVAMTAASSLRSSFQTNSKKGQQSVIDGADNPENIPDRVAYSLFLRMISGYKNETEKRYVEAYIEQMGIANKADAQALLAVAMEFKRRADDIEAEAKKARQRLNESATGREAAQATLRQLRLKRDSITDDIMSNLPRRLSQDGEAKVRRFINEQVKRKVRMHPAD
jgi:hypothetical protein